MQVNWDAVGAVGTWFGGIATFLAVVVALRESSRAYKPRVRAVADLHLYGSINGIQNECVEIVVTNVGSCRVSVKGLVVRGPGREPIKMGIDHEYADCQLFRTLECGEQIEREWPIYYFNMKVPSRSKRRLAGLARRIVGRPYSMAIVDTSGREFRVKVPPIVQDFIGSAQRWEK